MKRLFTTHAVKVYLLTTTMFFLVLNVAYAAPKPEQPPGGIDFWGGFDKVTGWLLWLIPVILVAGSLLIAYNGLFGVTDRSKRAEAKDNIGKLWKLGMIVWSIPALSQAVLLAIGISQGSSTGG